MHTGPLGMTIRAAEWPNQLCPTASGERRGIFWCLQSPPFRETHHRGGASTQHEQKHELVAIFVSGLPSLLVSVTGRSNNTLSSLLPLCGVTRIVSWDWAQTSVSETMDRAQGRCWLLESWL